MTRDCQMGTLNYISPEAIGGTAAAHDPVIKVTQEIVDDPDSIGPGGLVASTKTSESMPGFSTRGTSSEQSAGLVWSFLRALPGSPRIL